MTEQSVLDVSRPHPARVYSYLLGGKDNFAADRVAGNTAVEALPQLITSMRCSREFGLRAARFVASQRGIRQYVDVGVGLPGAVNVHEVVQRVDPTSRVLYVDNDRLVMTHARALLTSSREGIVGYLEADVREPDSIVDSAAFGEIIHRDQPVGLLLAAVLQDCPQDPRVAVRGLIKALPSGSYVVLSHPTLDPLPAAEREAITPQIADVWRPRTRDQIAAYLDGLELEEPGLVLAAQWRPSGAPPGRKAASALCYAAVARVP